MAPLEGLRVVEVSLGISAVGGGLAGSLPGRLLRALGAEVTHVQSEPRSTLDAGVEFARVWDRGKEIVVVGDADPARAAQTIAGIARDADVALLAGGEERLERGGLHYRGLARLNPRLVVGRIHPRPNALGPVKALERLGHARSGLLTQVRGHRPRPPFLDLPLANARPRP